MENRNNALISLIILVLTPLVAGDDEAPLSQSSSLVIASHCSSKCGDVTIPYPFGIEEGCYFAVDDNPSFSHPKKINCNYTFSPPKPFFGRNVHVTNISMEESEIWINGGVAVRCYGKDEYFIGGKNRSLEMVNYTISSAKNMFVATGCDTYAWFTGTRYGKPYKTGCMTTCNELDDVVDNQCNGVGCCQVSIPDGVTNLKVNAYSFDNHTNVDFNPCSAAYLVAKDRFKFKKDELMETLDFYNGKDEIPTILNWGIGSKKCSAATKDGDCLCKNNTDCINLKDQDGYRCKCKDGYIGNPYLPRGCTEINECMGANDCEKPEYCSSWYRGSGTTTNGCHSIIKIFIPVIVTAVKAYAWFTGFRHGEPYYTGCMTRCDNLNSVVDNQCNGVGCCDASIPDGATNITTTVGSYNNHTSVPFNPCSSAFPVAIDAFTFLSKNLTQKLGFYEQSPSLPAVFDWGIGTQSCLRAQKQGNCLCKNNTICSDIHRDQGGYRCECKDGFLGNPYLPQGIR